MKVCFLHTDKDIYNDYLQSCQRNGFQNFDEHVNDNQIFLWYYTMVCLLLDVINVFLKFFTFYVPPCDVWFTLHYEFQPLHNLLSYFWLYKLLKKSAFTNGPNCIFYARYIFISHYGDWLWSLNACLSHNETRVQSSVICGNSLVQRLYKALKIIWFDPRHGKTQNSIHLGDNFVQLASDVINI